MKIVGMVSSYTGLQNQYDWLWKQTPEPFGAWRNISLIARHPQPDFLLFYQYDFIKSPSKKPWWKSLSVQSKPEDELTFKVPKERSIYLLREPPLPEIVHINQANYQAAQNYCDYVSGPDQDAPQPDYMPAIWYLGNSFRELAQMPCPNKVSPCSWITSGISRTALHRRRLDFLRLVQEHEIECDFYGRNLPSWSKNHGQVQNKWHAMSPYFYNLAIENYADNELYVSEKLWDALLAWCLPIYYGGSAADKLLPPGSFLRIPSLDLKGIAYIKEVSANLDAWHQAKEAIAEARQIILHKLNLLEWLANFTVKF